MSSVLNSPIVFCEGKNDYCFLNKFFRTPNITFVEKGDKYSLHVFMAGYKKASPSAPCLAIRDRDLDFMPTVNIQLVETGRADVWATHRTCLESYWFDPFLIRQYLLWKKDAPNFRRRDLAIPSAAEIKAMIEDAARDIRYYAAARCALAEVKTIVGELRLHDKWNKDSGVLPISLQKEKCAEEGKNYLDKFNGQALMANKFDFESLFETYASRFEAQEFYDKSEYLTWFHGKDLRTAFNKQADASKGLKGWNFSFTKYVEDFCSIENTELKFEVDLKKRPEFADLVELKKKLRTWAKGCLKTAQFEQYKAN